MTRQAEHPSLQLDQHLRFQQVLHVARCIGVLLLLAVLLTALAGGLGGNGPLAQARAGGGAFDARYPRFARYQMPVRFELEVDSAAIPGGTFELVFDGEHARGFSFEQVLPQPTRVAAADDRIHFTFQAAPGERQLVVLQGQPETIGWLSGTVSVAGQPRLRIDSFVYP